MKTSQSVKKTNLTKVFFAMIGLVGLIESTQAQTYGDGAQGNDCYSYYQGCKDSNPYGSDFDEQQIGNHCQGHFFGGWNEDCLAWDRRCYSLMLACAKGRIVPRNQPQEN